MTEDLWYHALRFLDKYRTDVRAYDLDELYEFADKTGILERHKQLLAKPYHDSQVDMKIMYYELIKMLIDYERKNHPESYDATKTVGKIEGYQELTNKLQRYLNQRFIEDIDKIAEQQLNFTQINISQKFEQLEANFVQLETRYSSLEQHCSSLEQNQSSLSQTLVSLTTTCQGLERTNSDLTQRVTHLEQVETSLYEEIRQLRDKDVELEQLIGQLRDTQEAATAAEATRSSAVEDKLKLGEDTVLKINQQIEKLEAEASRLSDTDKNQDSRLSNLEASSAILDNKLNSLESADFFLQESHRILTEKTTNVENELKQHSGLGTNISERMDSLAGNVEALGNEHNGMKAELGNMRLQLQDTEAKTSNLEADGHASKENIERIGQALQSINLQISFIESSASTSWETVEAKLFNYQTDIANLTSEFSTRGDVLGNLGKEMEQLKDVNVQFMTSFELQKNDILQLQESQRGNEKGFEDFHNFQARIHNELTDVQGKMGNFNAKMEDMDKEQMERRAALERQDQKITKLIGDLQQLDAGHAEAVEKVNEVHLLAANLDIHIKNTEEKIEKQKTADFANVAEKLSKLEVSHGTLDRKIEDLDAKGQESLKQLQAEKSALDNKVRSLDETSQGLQDMLNQVETIQLKKFTNLDDLLQDHGEKIRVLEEASMKHYEHAQYVENLNHRVIQLDEARQQSEVKARDEVDGTLVRYNSQLSDIQTELESRIFSVENQLKRSQEHVAEATADIQRHVEELESKRKQSDQSIENLNRELQESANKVFLLQGDFEQKIKDINGSANVMNKKVQDLEDEQRANIERLVTLQETSMIEKATFIESLSEKVIKIDTERQETEQKMNLQNEKLIEKNANAIQALEKEVNAKLDASEQARKEELQNLSLQADNLKVQLNLLLIEQQKQVDELEEVKKFEAEKLTNVILDVEKTSKVLEQKLRDATQDIEVGLKGLDDKIANNVSYLKEEQTEEVKNIKVMLQDEINKSFEKTDNKVREAENHVENLRELNGKLIDQVKEKMKNYETEQSKISEDLKTNNNKQMDTLKESFNDQLQALISIKDEHTISISSISSTMLALKETLTTQSEEIGSNTVKIQKLEQSQEIQDNKLDHLEQISVGLSESYKMVSEEAKTVTSLLKDSQMIAEQALKNEVVDLIKEHKDDCTAVTDSLTALVASHSNQIKDAYKRQLELSQKIQEVEQSLLQSLVQQTENLDSKIDDIQNRNKEFRGQAEESIIANTTAITVNSNLIDGHSKDLLSVLTLKGELAEKINVLQSALDTSANEFQVLENKMLAIIEILKAEQEADRKKVKDTERHVTELDDTLTLLTPDIRTIDKRVTNIEENQNNKKVDDIVNQVAEIRDSLNVVTKDAQERFEYNTENYNQLVLKCEDTTKDMENLKVYYNAQFKEVQELIHVIQIQEENLTTEIRESNEKGDKQNNENIAQLQEDQEKLRIMVQEGIKLVDGKHDKLFNNVEELKMALEENIRNLEGKETLEKGQLVKSLQDMSTQILDLEQGIGSNGEKVKVIVDIHEKLENYTQEVYSKIQQEVGSTTSMLQQSLDGLRKECDGIKAKNAAVDDQLSKALEQINQEIEKTKETNQALGKDINNTDEETRSLHVKLVKLEDEVVSKINAIGQAMKDNEEKIGMIQDDGKNTLEKIISLEEATLQHAEKAQYIEALSARVSQVDEMRQKSEERTKDDVNGILNGNSEMIQQLQDQLRDETNNINSFLQSLKHDVMTGKQDMDAMKEEKKNFQDALTKYQEMIEIKLQEVDIAGQSNDKNLKNLEVNVQNADKAIQDMKLETQMEINHMKEGILHSTNDMIVNIKSELRDLTDSTGESIKNHQAQLQALDAFCASNREELHEIEKEHGALLAEVKNVNFDSIVAIRNDYDIKLKDILESIQKQTSSIDFATTFVNSSQEIFNTLTMGNAQQEERIKALETQFQVLDKKLESLESADLFLQEAHRMLTDKTTHVESESRKMEENLSSQLNDQQEEIQTKLKVQVASLLKEVGDLTSEKDKIFETIDKIKESGLGHGDKIKELEEGTLMSAKSLQDYVDKMLQRFENDHKMEVEKLESKIDNSTFLIQGNDSNIRNNSEKILGLHSELETFSKNYGDLNSNMVSSFQIIHAEYENLVKIVDKVHQDTEAMTSKWNGEIGDIVPQVWKNTDNLTQLQQSFESHNSQISSLVAGIEKLTEDSSSILDELNNAEEKFNEVDGKLAEIQEKLDNMENRNDEIINKIQEVTVLTSNIEVSLKAQEEKFENQKAVDMEGVYFQIEHLKQKNGRIESDVEDLALEKKNFFDQLNLLKTQMDTEKTATKAEAENIKIKIDSYHSVISTLETEFNQLVKDSKNFEDNNKTMLSRLTNLELLADKITQLDQIHQKDREQHSKDLEEAILQFNMQIQMIKEGTERKFEVILADDLAVIKDFGEMLKKEVETLKLDKDIKSKQITDLDHETKALTSKVEAEVEDLQKTLKDQIKGINVRLDVVESDNGDHLEKLISLEEATFVHAEKAKYVDSLNERLGKMDEIRQQSEAKSKEELEHTVAGNARTIEALKHELAERMQKLKDDVQGDFSSLKHDMESRIATSSEAMTNSINGDLESRIIAIYSKFEEHKSLIEKTFTSVTKITEKVAQNESQQFGLQEGWLKQYDGKMEALRMDFDDKIRDLFTTASEHSNILTENNISIMQLNEINVALSGQVGQNERDIVYMKETMDQDRDLVVLKFKEEKESLESYFNSLASRVDTIQTTQTEESSRLVSVVGQLEVQGEQVTRLLERLQELSRQGQDHKDLILAIEKSLRDKAAELDQDLKSYKTSSREDIRNLRADMDTDKENLWTLIIEIYSAFRGYTLVLKSEGAVREHQADVLGVYRMVDNYNERPVYKQDGGENYIYYSAASNSWLVGTVVGHQYGWLRNGTAHAGTKKWIPDLRTGWEYRPLVRSDDLSNTWCTDDGTLRIESLRDIEKVNELIRDIKHSKEID